jgi:hypothetical protein
MKIEKKHDFTELLIIDEKQNGKYLLKKDIKKQIELQIEFFIYDYSKQKIKRKY